MELLNTIVEFSTQHKTYFLAFHILSVVVGFGGAIFVDILFIEFLKDLELSQKEASILHLLSRIMFWSLLVILVSGMGLYFGNMEKYNASPGFMLKMLAVLVLTINGFFLHFFLSPVLMNISFTQGPDVITREFRILRKIAFAMGAISFVSWWTAFFIAMFKALVPLQFVPMLMMYFCVLLFAVVTSQLAEIFLTWHAHRKMKAADQPVAQPVAVEDIPQETLQAEAKSTVDQLLAEAAPLPAEEEKPE